MAALRSCVSIALIFFISLSAPFDSTAQSRKKKKAKKPAAVPCRTGCRPDTTAPDIATSTADDAAALQQLSELARSLHNATPGSYDKLSAFATKHAGDVWGARAALALGYDDYQKNRLAPAMAWFAKAKGEAVLQEYVLYWHAQTNRVAKRNSDAYADLQKILTENPNTAIKEQVLESFAPVSVEMGRAQAAVDALNSYSATNSKPALLLERAHAYQSVGQAVRAVKDYQSIFYKFPLADETKTAGNALAVLQKQLRSEFPYGTAEMQEQRAQAFFDAHKWREARPEFEKLVSMLHEPSNPVRQRAQLRVAQCRVQLKASVSLVSSLAPTDPEVDAERLYAISQFQRTAKNESAMLSAIEVITTKYPNTRWADEALMAAGNYYWVQLDRNKAATYYQRVLDTYPNSKNDFNAEWRIAWVSYMNHAPDADDRFHVFLLKYPVSANTVDALYWLGRNAERSGNPAHARSFYNKAVERFPQTYFGYAAAAELAKLGPGEENPSEFLDKIPPPPALRPFDEPIPAAAEDRWARAQALRSIAFDSSAEQELKSAFFATGSPRFLLEAAQAAFDQGHFATGMAYARTIVPSFDSRNFNEIPLTVWKALYPLPYESPVRRESGKNELDPAVVAGLIRQESTFQADALSHANAYGLMQLLPKTAKILAKQLRVKYTKDRLYEPDYNIQLGTFYFKGLVQLTGAPEYALAAYNAGEDRIAAWKAERIYDEVPELVESIPFTETREYVQIVLRNAQLYRMIYGTGAPTPATTAATGGTSHQARR
ncbi:MAG TPA: transglycosylase SLT domain-containing protein [Candidatus Sulfotelmatobacter sp.]|nr:transglycosylase SLT domain-containing protein [Candidatus Sulfotelmatobacter sp.]